MARWTHRPEVKCIYCKQKGHIYSTVTKEPVGTDPGKFALGLLTFGLSVLFTGIVRYRYRNRMFCKQCGMEWIRGTVS